MQTSTHPTTTTASPATWAATVETLFEGQRWRLQLYLDLDETTLLAVDYLGRVWELSPELRAEAVHEYERFHEEESR